MPLMFEQKHPADLVARRVMCIARNLAASAVAIAAGIVTPTASVTATVVAAIIAVVAMPAVARGDVNHRRRAVPHWRRAVNDGRWGVIHRRRINRRRWWGDVYRCRISDRDVERDSDGPTGAGLGGERGCHPDDSDYDQCFSFHSWKVGRFVHGVLQGVEIRNRCLFVNGLAGKGGVNE